MRSLTELAEQKHLVIMSVPGVLLGSFVFWFTVYLAVHFHNSTNLSIAKMGKPERFAMELLSSSAAAIAIMFTLGCIDMAIRTWT